MIRGSSSFKLNKDNVHCFAKAQVAFVTYQYPSSIYIGFFSCENINTKLKKIVTKTMMINSNNNNFNNNNNDNN